MAGYERHSTTVSHGVRIPTALILLIGRLVDFLALPVPVPFVDFGSRDAVLVRNLRNSFVTPVRILLECFFKTADLITGQNLPPCLRL